MNIFYASDSLDVINHMSAVACWAWAAYFGWTFAKWQLVVFKEFFRFLRSLIHRRP